MATRGIYHFFDSDGETYRVYKHWDNYPSGAYEFIKNALKLSWCLPRFEASEFSCAFIAANKEGEGGVRLIRENVTDMGQDYDYYISCVNGKLIVKFDDYDKDGKLINFKGTLSQLKKYIKKNEE